MGKIEAKQVSTEFVTTETKDAVKLDELGEPTDVTTLDTDASRHGLCPKLSGTATEYLDGSGAFSTPAGGGGGSGVEYSGDPADTLRGDGAWRPASFESLETIDFVDSLNNSDIHPNWTQTPNTGTVSEDGTKLTSSHAGGITTSWWDPDYNIPNVGIDVEPRDFDMMVHISNLAAINNAALVILHLDGDNTKFIRTDLRYSSSEYRQYASNNNDIGTNVFTLVGQNNCWIIMLRRGASVTIGYSTNSVDNQPTVNDFTVLETFDQAGLFSLVKNKLLLGGGSWSGGTAPSFSIHYRNFSLKYETVSTRLRGYVGQGSDFYDAFNNSSIHGNWTEHTPGGGTVTEDSEKLVVHQDASSNLTWYTSENYNAPGVYLPLEPLDFTVKVHVSNVSGIETSGGAIINYLDGDKSKYHRWELRYRNAEYQILSIYNDDASTEVFTVGQNNVWLAVIRRGYKIMFLHSLNSVDNEPSIDEMVLDRTLDVKFDYTKNLLLLACLQYIGNPVADIYFKRFSLVYNNINLYENASYLAEQVFTTNGTETPDADVLCNLNKVPGGEGRANTPSGYHLAFFRNGQKLGYVGAFSGSAEAQRLQHRYNPATNVVTVKASGIEETFEALLIEGAPSASTIQSGSFKWKYLGEDTEVGLDALAVYQFDGSGQELDDRSGNGYTLTVGTGTRYYTSIGGLKALQFNALQLVGPDTDDLRLVNSMSIEVVFFGVMPSASEYIVTCTPDTSVESLVSNVLYGLGRSNEGKTRYFHEYGAGGTDWLAAGQAEVHYEPIYFAVTRDATNGLKFYINGILSETQSITNMPEKDVAGNLQKLRISGIGSTNANAFQGAITSVRIIDSELTAGQIANVYDQIKTTNIETPVSLPVDQQGYIVEDNFDDDTLHERWTVENDDPANITITPGGGLLKVAFSGSGTGNQRARFILPLTEYYFYRNFTIELHAKYGAGTHDDVGIVLRFEGTDSAGAANHMVFGLNRDDGLYRIIAVDRSASYKLTSISNPYLWCRFRNTLDKVYTDYYEADHTDNPNDQDKWRQYTNSGYPPWERVPTTAPPYDYPQKIERVVIEVNTWDSKPTVDCEIRRFKLVLF